MMSYTGEDRDTRHHTHHVLVESTIVEMSRMIGVPCLQVCNKDKQYEIHYYTSIKKNKF